jgi:mRNA-degrading endonuclease toxin of MazEF toxin-antitoxin module
VREIMLWLLVVLPLAGTAWLAAWLVLRRRARRGRPQPGEIWWADVPYEDGPGHKVRPCLVLRPVRVRVEVLKITSQDRSDRRDHVRIPTRPWDARATHDSYLDLSDPLRLRPSAFVRRAGRVDAATWRLVRGQHRTGSVTGG